VSEKGSSKPHPAANDHNTRPPSGFAPAPEIGDSLRRRGSGWGNGTAAAKGERSDREEISPKRRWRRYDGLWPMQLATSSTGRSLSLVGNGFCGRYREAGPIPQPTDEMLGLAGEASCDLPNATSVPTSFLKQVLSLDTLRWIPGPMSILMAPKWTRRAKRLT
jgi:hypothetical protein